MYRPDTVFVVELTLPQTSVDNLEAEPDEYQPGTFSMAETDGTPEGIGTFSAPLPVSVRLKGKASFRSLGEKAAFKLKFGKTERFLGLKKMTLNNMVEDPSMLRETLSYAAFRAAGVPAPRTGFVYLKVNGEDFGLYLNLETLDDVSLERIFGSFDDEVQHLYEGEDGHDVKPGEAGAFEVDEGDDADVADLEALIEAVDSEGTDAWSERVAATADLAEMTTMWAVEKYVAHWDGYSGKAGAHQPNNYYLLSDPLGRFQMLPWGTDETWSYGHPVSFEGEGGVMFNHCLEDGPCAAQYRERVAATVESVASIDPSGLAARTAAMLRPWQQLEGEASTRQEHDEEEIAEGVAAVLAFIPQRRREALDWLSPQAPPPPGSASPSDSPSPLPDRGGAVDLHPMRIISMRRTEKAVWTRLTLSEAGTVTQWARRRGGARNRAACRAVRTVHRARTISMRCGLDGAGGSTDASDALSIVTRFRSPATEAVLRRAR